MARRVFTAHRDGTVGVRLDGRLRAVLAAQLGDLDLLLAAEDPPPPGRSVDPLAELTGMVDVTDRPPPADPALRRLRPDAYAPEVDDGRAAAEYRRLAGGELAALQRRRVATVLATLERGDRFDLAEAEAQAWVGAVNDLRLVLGSRLGITDDEPGPPTPALRMFLLLGHLLHELLVALGAPDEF